MTSASSDSTPAGLSAGDSIPAAPAAASGASSQRRSAAVVLNRQSGTIAGIGPEVIAEGLVRILEEEGIRATVNLVTGKEVTRALEEARDGGADMVIVGGGDGSVAAAASVMAGGRKPLGILPLGTYNLAARDAGMPMDWEEAARALGKAPVVRSDLLDIAGELFFCVMVLGFYPALVMGRKAYHGSWIVRAWQSGTMLLKNAAQVPPLDLVLKTEGQEQRIRTGMAVLTNNDFKDLFGLIPQRQSLDAGYFTVYLSKHRTRRGLFRTFLSWLFGRWRQDREITSIHATEMTISARRRSRLPVMRDGEIGRVKVPFTVRIVPKALPLLAPRAMEETDREPAKAGPTAAASA